MLKIIQGDLFRQVQPPCVIAHGCNALGAMGEGFAKQLRERFPATYLEYRELCLKRQLKLGTWHWYCENNTVIFNLITQDSYGYDPDTVYVNYEAVRKTLSVVDKFSRMYDLPIHMPFIGAGHAHGDKAKLMAIFEEVFNAPRTVSKPYKRGDRPEDPKELTPSADAMLYLLPNKV